MTSANACVVFSGPCLESKSESGSGLDARVNGAQTQRLGNATLFTNCHFGLNPRIYRLGSGTKKPILYSITYASI